MHPLHVAQALRLQILHRLVGRIDAQALILGELLGRHAGLILALEQRHHRARLLGDLDLLGRGQHAVEHAAHVIVQRARLGVAREKILDALVDVDEPGAELLERALQFDARGPAFEQVGFERLRRALVEAALFLEGQHAPRLQLLIGRAGEAVPAQQGRCIVDDLLLAGRALRAGQEVGRERQVVLEEVVGALMEERGQVGPLQQADRVGVRGEGAARGGAAVGLVEDVRVVRVEGAAVAGGGLDLLGAESDVVCRRPVRDTGGIIQVFDDQPVVLAAHRSTNRFRDVETLGVLAFRVYTQRVLYRQVHRHHVLAREPVHGVGETGV